MEYFRTNKAFFPPVPAVLAVVVPVVDAGMSDDVVVGAVLLVVVVVGGKAKAMEVGGVSIPSPTPLATVLPPPALPNCANRRSNSATASAGLVFVPLVVVALPPPTVRLDSAAVVAAGLDIIMLAVKTSCVDYCAQ